MFLQMYVLPGVISFSCFQIHFGNLLLLLLFSQCVTTLTLGSQLNVECKGP
jgi:hypothetical protein